MELRIHPPRTTNVSTLKILVHRNNINIPLHTLISNHFNAVRYPGKSAESWPSWLLELIHSLPHTKSSIFLPQYPPQPREVSATVFGHSFGPATRFENGHYQVDASRTLGQMLRGQEFLEFPTFELFATSPTPSDIFILNKWNDADTEKEPTPKRRRVEPLTEFVGNILTEYGSDDESGCSPQDGDEMEKKDICSDILGYNSESDLDSVQSSAQDGSESDMESGKVPGDGLLLGYSTDADPSPEKSSEEDESISDAEGGASDTNK